jgi:hypothetical protein
MTHLEKVTFLMTSPLLKFVPLPGDSRLAHF